MHGDLMTIIHNLHSIKNVRMGSGSSRVAVNRNKRGHNVYDDGDKICKEARTSVDLIVI
jgi:hypothetical protein